MTTEKIIEGLQILQKYYKKPGGYNVVAEHDQLYVFATDKPVSKADLAKLVELGWTQEVEDPDDEDWDGDFSASMYDPEASWTCFV